MLGFFLSFFLFFLHKEGWKERREDDIEFKQFIFQGISLMGCFPFSISISISISISASVYTAVSSALNCC
jgi:hypothetical protein